ncbi:hypothetical protein HDE_00250 [Halotydeus destructor]|nr:hypothetical protein HDE_00250 [Halotydeus destructor]
MFNMFETTIDATVSINNGTIYLFRRNHYYSHNFDTNITSSPKLIQNSLFICSDNFYTSFKALLMLNITNAEQFKEYRMQFVAKNSQIPASKVTKAGRETISLLFLTLISLIVSAMVCILSIMALWVQLKNMKPSSEDLTELSDADASGNQGSVSTETIAVKIIHDSR